MSSDAVRALFEDSSGTLWVGTWGGGLDRFDRAIETFTHYRNDPNDPQSLSQDGVFSIYQDATGALWVGTISGDLNRFDPQTGTFRRFGPDDKDPSSFDATQVVDMFGDADTLWLATGNGVFALDLQPKPFHILQHDPEDANSLAANEIDAIYEDPQRILWVSTAGSGLNRIDRASDQVSHFRNDPDDPTSVSGSEIWSIAPSRDGSLWLVTFDGGLEKFDPESGQSIHYRHDLADAASLSSDRTTAVLENQSGVVWVGTWDAGLDRFDPATGTFTHYVHDPADPTSLSDNAVFTVTEDRNGDLWIGTVAGGLDRFNPATGTFTRFLGEPGNPQSLPSNSVTSVLLDRAGRLWVGTWGGGLARLNPDTGEVTSYDHDNGLPSDAIFEIQEDDLGRLWLSTSNDLSRFDPDAATFRNYDEHDGLPGNVFESGVSFQSPSGEMFFGATNGLLAFYPDQIQDNVTIPPVVITDFELANQPVPIGEGSVLRQAIDETDALKLSYLDRVISFEFAALNYSFPQKNRYRYMLEGFGPAWTEVGSDRRLATYTNLDPGDYVFRVTGSNDDGIWTEDELLQSDVRALYLSPDQRAQTVRQLGPEGFLSNYGLQLRRRDGSFYFVNLTMSRLELAGQPVLLGVADDVTEELEARQALNALYQMSYDMASISELQALIDHAVPHLHEIVDFQRAALMLVEDGEESLTIHAYLSPTSSPELTMHQVPISRWPFLRTALKRREITDIQDMQASETIQAELDGMQKSRWADALKASRSWLGLPLLVGERTIGLLNILHGEANHYKASDVDLARTFANQLALAIDNIHLNEQAGRTAAADERSRIARELHDSVTQTLFTASVLAEATPRIWNKDRDIARQNLERLSLLIRGALADMRSMLLELRSDAPPNQNLSQLLSTLVDAARARSNVNVSLTIEGDPQSPAEVTLAFYRIGQEALNNAIKHAEATRVDISLLDQPDRVELHIRDDGRGFDPQLIPDGHLGISIMTERAKKIGGDLQIQSSPDHGTEVRMTWPAPTGEIGHD